MTIKSIVYYLLLLLLGNKKDGLSSLKCKQKVYGLSSLCFTDLQELYGNTIALDYGNEITIK